MSPVGGGGDRNPFPTTPNLHRLCPFYLLSTLLCSRNCLDLIMEAKIPSGPSPGLAQRKPKSDHPLGRVLEPLGFYRHPILYAPPLL